MSSFLPYFTGSIASANANLTFFEVSSALGATQMATVFNNMEWNYHFINSQTRINYQLGANGTTYPQTVVSYLSTSVNFLIGSYGPFRLNLDKNGNPTPLYLAFIPKIVNTTGVTGTFTAHLRTFDSLGQQSQVEVGTFTSNSYATTPNAQELYWQHFATPSASYISSSMNISSSVFQTKFVLPYQVNTRTTKSLASPDAVQNICLAYVDLYYKNISVTGSNATTVICHGLYGREVNVLGDYNAI